jgi:hypothetical protein
LTDGPPFSHGILYSNRGSFSEGGHLNAPMTGSSFRNVGRIGGPSAAPQQTGSQYTNKGGFLRK